jgi:hypothetical protein
MPHNGAIDVVPGGIDNENVIGTGVNALYTGTLYFQAGDDYRAYLIVGDYQITYSHVDFGELPGRNPGQEQFISVTAGQQIGQIMDISLDAGMASEGSPNHLHLGISTRSQPRQFYDPTFLLGS